MENKKVELLFFLLLPSLSPLLFVSGNIPYFFSFFRWSKGGGGTREQVDDPLLFSSTLEMINDVDVWKYLVRRVESNISKVV